MSKQKRKSQIKKKPPAKPLPPEKRQHRATLTLQVDIWLIAHGNDFRGIDDLETQAEIYGEGTIKRMVSAVPEYRDAELKGWRVDWKRRREGGNLEL